MAVVDSNLSPAAAMRTEAFTVAANSFASIGINPTR